MDASSSVFPVQRSSQHGSELEWTGVSTRQPVRAKAPGCPTGAGSTGLRPLPTAQRGRRLWAQPRFRMGTERLRVLTPRRTAPKLTARCSGRAALRCLRSQRWWALSLSPGALPCPHSCPDQPRRRFAFPRKAPRRPVALGKPTAAQAGYGRAGFAQRSQAGGSLALSIARPSRSRSLLLYPPKLTHLPHCSLPPDPLLQSASPSTTTLSPLPDGRERVPTASHRVHRPLRNSSSSRVLSPGWHTQAPGRRKRG